MKKTYTATFKAQAVWERFKETKAWFKIGHFSLTVLRCGDEAMTRSYCLIALSSRH